MKKASQSRNVALERAQLSHFFPIVAKRRSEPEKPSTTKPLSSSSAFCSALLAEEEDDGARTVGKSSNGLLQAHTHIHDTKIPNSPKSCTHDDDDERGAALAQQRVGEKAYNFASVAEATE